MLLNGDCFEILSSLKEPGNYDLVYIDLPFPQDVIMPNLKDKSCDEIVRIEWNNLIPLNDFVVINNRRMSFGEYFEKDYISANKIGANTAGLWSRLDCFIKKDSLVAIICPPHYVNSVIASNESLFRGSYVVYSYAYRDVIRFHRYPKKWHMNILLFSYAELPLIEKKKLVYKLGFNEIPEYADRVRADALNNYIVNLRDKVLYIGNKASGIEKEVTGVNQYCGYVGLL